MGVLSIIDFKKDGGGYLRYNNVEKLDTVQCGIGNIWSANVAISNFSSDSLN